MKKRVTNKSDCVEILTALAGSAANATTDQRTSVPWRSALPASLGKRRIICMFVFTCSRWSNGPDGSALTVQLLDQGWPLAHHQSCCVAGPQTVFTNYASVTSKTFAVSLLVEFIGEHLQSQPRQPTMPRHDLQPFDTLHCLRAIRPPTAHSLHKSYHPMACPVPIACIPSCPCTAQTAMAQAP